MNTICTEEILLAFHMFILFSQSLTHSDELYSYSFKLFIQLCKVLTGKALQPIERHGYNTTRFSETDSC